MIYRHNNFDLKSYNTFNIKATANQLIKFTSVAEIQHIINYGELLNSKIFILGGGSNLLFTKNFEGIILKSEINGIELILEDDENIELKVGSGVVWDTFVKYAVENNYYGCENLSNIHGNVGASAVQNIGAYGVEAKDIITKVECVSLKTGEILILKNKDCKFEYRNSVFKSEEKNKYLITNVYFQLSKKKNFNLEYANLKQEFISGNELTLEAVRSKIIEIRQNKLPDIKQFGNAGSFFKNPIIDSYAFEKLHAKYPTMPYFELEENNFKIPAGWLIENAGWKEKPANNVSVYHKQALVIINLGNATAEDIINYSNSIVKDVINKYGIKIEKEVIFV